MNQQTNNLQLTLKQLDRSANSLLEDTSNLKQHLHDFCLFLQGNGLVQGALKPILARSDVSSANWWQEQNEKVDWESRVGTWYFPIDSDDMFKLRYDLICDQANNKDPNFIYQQLRLTFDWSVSNKETAKQLFLSKIIRPFYEDLRSLLDQNTITDQQLEQAPASHPMTELAVKNESRIFLSHKSANKPLVEKYHKVLAELGYSPWLDEFDMPAGTNLNRGILDGINESCAVVFFITEDFKDERFLADEIDYAKTRKSKQGKKFAIITLIFSDSADIPELLGKYVCKKVDNDLIGLYEIIRALPIKLGPVHWTERAMR